MDDLLMRLLTPMNDMTLQQVFKERDEAADKIATLQARVAELEAERDDAVIKRAAWELEAKILQARVAELEAAMEHDKDVYYKSAEVLNNQYNIWKRRAEAAEALLSKAVKAGMLEGANIKPLEWEDWSARHRTNVTAMTEFGRYGVMQLHFPEMHYKIEPPHGKPSSADTLEAAKDAAQADYEARIRAALDEPDPETIARIVASLKEGRG